MVFGKMNWSALLNYIVQPADMELFQTYVNNYLGTYLPETRTTGVIYGGQITVVAGLQVQVAAGLALMPNGQLIAWPNLNATMAAADPSNPRIDRVELSYSSVANSAVLDVNNVSKTLDFLFQPALNVVTGTPAGSPAAPTATPANVSLGYVQVNAAQTNLVSGNISQVPDAGKVLSAQKVGDNAGYIRYNDSLGCFQVSASGVVWSTLMTTALPEASATIANNQSSLANITGLILDTSLGTSFDVAVEITRQTGSGFRKCMGSLKCYYDSNALAMKITPVFYGDDAVVDFDAAQIGVTTQYQLKYKSDNMSGTGYAGTIKFALNSLL